MKNYFEENKTIIFMVFYLITCVRVTIDKNSLENIFIYYHIASIKMKELEILLQKKWITI